MTVAQRKDLVIDQAATFELNINHLNPDGTPIDHTGYTGEFVISKLGSRIPTEYEAAIVLDSEGHISVTITDEVTLTIPVGKYSYMLNVEEPGGAVKRLLTGEITVRF
jgi:hypothetical protein